MHRLLYSSVLLEIFSTGTWVHTCSYSIPPWLYVTVYEKTRNNQLFLKTAISAQCHCMTFELPAVQIWERSPTLFLRYDTLCARPWNIKFEKLRSKRVAMGVNDASIYYPYSRIWVLVVERGHQKIQPSHTLALVLGYPGFQQAVRGSPRPTSPPLVQYHPAIQLWSSNRAVKKD